MRKFRRKCCIMLLNEKEVNVENLEKVFEIIQSDKNFISSNIEPEFRIDAISHGGEENYYLSEIIPIDYHVIYVSYKTTNFQIHPNSPYTTDATFYVPFAIKRQNFNQNVSIDTLSNDHALFMRRHYPMLDINGKDMRIKYLHFSHKSPEKEDYDRVIGSHLVLTDPLTNNSKVSFEYTWLHDGIEYEKESFDSAGSSCTADFVNGTYNMSLEEYLEYELYKKCSINI